MRIEPGQVIHGFAGGHFGRDSRHCRMVEAAGRDWVVTRQTDRWLNVAEVAVGRTIHEDLEQYLQPDGCDCDPEI